MRKTLFLSTALGAAALLATPALAQSGRGMHDSDRVAPLGMQQQAARHADSMAGQREVSSLLHRADQAAARGQWGQANELLERAQTAQLNSHALGGGASTGNMRPFEDARQALASRDRAGARSALQAAMSDTGRDSSMMGSGSSAGSMPMQGGGSSMGHSSMDSSGSMSGYGSRTMRDSGMGDRSMSRADIILAQGGGGSGSEGSGGISGTTRGSPGVGAPGSTPQSLPQTATQPPQGSALPGSMSSTTGPGAPSPGTLTPAPGVTSAGPGTTAGSGGANPPATSRGTQGGQNR